MQARRIGAIASHQGDSRFVPDYPTDCGRLTRVRKCDGDTNGVAYIVAAREADQAIAIIRSVVDLGAAVEDAGRVSEALVHSLGLASGDFVRIAGGRIQRRQ